MVKSTDSTARTGMYEPANSCFAYIPATTTNGPPTLANSKSKCATLSSQVSSLGGTCMLGQLLDQATLANLSGQGVLKMGSKAFLNLRQLTSVVEPACDWYWVALDGSYVYPDPPILWYATEPDGAGVFPGGAHQGVFIYGLDSLNFNNYNFNNNSNHYVNNINYNCSYVYEHNNDNSSTYFYNHEHSNKYSSRYNIHNDNDDQFNSNINNKHNSIHYFYHFNNNKSFHNHFNIINYINNHN
uniref:C-type lectin domain-containing protein n=1 Tax=Plectus sambesii TaxID=2011161 RepID=A0A914W6P6_9BILA